VSGAAKEGGTMFARGSRIAAIGVVLIVAAAACTGTSTERSTPSGSAATSATLNYNVNSQVMIGWDPSTGYSNEIIAMNNMYEQLTRYNSETQQVDPLLATEWSTSDDGLTWTFTIRQGVTFHSGRTLTAEDVKASIDRTMQVNGGAAYIWGPVKSIDAPSADTVVFNLKYPAPIDLIASADYAAYIFDTKAAGGQDLGKWFEQGHEAGTGPYTLESWNKGQETELRLKAYTDYWGGWDGAHYSRYVFTVTPEATTAAQLLRSGQATIVERMTPQLWQTFQNQDGFTTTNEASWQTLLAMLNTASGPLADVNVRRAVASAIDYDGMIAALHGGAQLISGYVPPGLWGHSDDLPNPTFDQSKAQDLLDQAGYGPNGKPMDLTLTYTQGDADEQLVGQLIKSDLAKLNINVDVRPLAWPAQWAKAKSANEADRQDILLFYWWPDYADPYSWFINLFHTEDKPFFNLTYYSDPKLDQMIDSVESLAATDREQAVSTYQTMQEMLLQSMPAISLYTQVYQKAMQSSVSGFVDNPAYPNVVFGYDLQPTA
jgi:peptide/nickel transport system substrate-binding protein